MSRKCPHEAGLLGVMAGLTEDCRDRGAPMGNKGLHRLAQSSQCPPISPATDPGSLPPSSGYIWSRDQKAMTHRSQWSFPINGQRVHILGFVAVWSWSYGLLCYNPEKNLKTILCLQAIKTNNQQKTPTNPWLAGSGLWVIVC